MNYGYIRVSAKDQNEARQLAAMEKLDIPPGNLYIDKQSGKDFQRPAYRRMLRRLRSGDVLYVLSIDRLGRNYDEILEQWRVITKRKQADIVVLDFPLLDTRARMEGQDLTGRFVANLVLQILAYVAQKERENIHQRQAQGIAAARARGVKLGAEPKPFPPDFDELFQRWRRKEITNAEMARRCDMDISTVYRKLREAGIPLQAPTDRA